MAQNRFLAGVGTALILKGNELIGVAKTLTDSGLNFAITGDEIRGGQGNALLARYFHDSSLTVSMVDAMFDLNYFGLTLGANVQMGGLSIKEEELVVADGAVSVSEAPVAFDGSMIGWYKKPSDTEWQIGTLSGKSMAIGGATDGASYCVKYFYNNENAKSLTIKSQYVPAVVHLVIMTDLYSGKVGTQSDTTKYGRLIVDIPQFQFSGNQDLALAAASAATVSLEGMALAVLDGATCEEDGYYGTMTEEVYGAKWQDEVIALAAVNSEIEIAAGDTEALDIRVVFGGGIASQKKDNSNFTFESSAANYATVDVDGVVKGIATGKTNIEVTLTGSDVAPCFVTVDVQ